MPTALVESDQYKGFVCWLRSVLNDRAKEHLDDNALCAYLRDMHCDGYIEISGQYTASGNPVTGCFPELTR